MRSKSLKTRINNQVDDFQIKEQLENTSDNKKRIIELIEKNKNQIERAFPKQVNIERVIRTIITALSREPLLTKCTPVSILGCAIQTAQLGLEVDSLLGQCYFVPFFSSKKNLYEAQLIIGYRGYIDLAYRSGFVKSIYANVVYKGDILEYQYGHEQVLKHIPSNSDKIRGWDDIIASYAYLYTTLGGYVFKVLDKSDIMYAKMHSKTKSELSVWNTAPAAMAMKSALRQIIKFAPLSPSLRVVDMLESEYEDEGQNWDAIINIEEVGNADKNHQEIKTEQTVQLQGQGTTVDAGKSQKNESKDSQQGFAGDKNDISEIAEAQEREQGLFE